MVTDSESLLSIKRKEEEKRNKDIEELFADDVEIEETDVEKKGDLNHLIINSMSTIHLKLAFLLVIIYIILNSEAFIENVLSKINGTTADSKLTNKGVIISAMFLAISYIIIDLIF